MQNDTITHQLVDLKEQISESLINHDTNVFFDIMRQLYEVSDNDDNFSNLLTSLDLDLDINDKLNLIIDYSKNSEIHPFFSYVYKHLFSLDDFDDNLCHIIPFITTPNSNDLLLCLIESNHINKEVLSLQPQLIKSVKFFIKLFPILDLNNQQFQAYYSHFLNEFSIENFGFDSDDKPHNLTIINQFLNTSHENKKFIAQFTHQHLDNLDLLETELLFLNQLSLYLKLNDKLPTKNSVEQKTKI